MNTDSHTSTSTSTSTDSNAAISDEARVLAVLLGDADAAERSAVDALLAANPALRQWRAQAATILPVLLDALRRAEPEPLRMDAARRVDLLAKLMQGDSERPTGQPLQGCDFSSSRQGSVSVPSTHPCPMIGNAVGVSETAASGISNTTPMQNSEVHATPLQPVAGDLPAKLMGSAKSSAGVSDANAKDVPHCDPAAGVGSHDSQFENENANGVPQHSPGLTERSDGYPGKPSSQTTTPTGLPIGTTGSQNNAGGTSASVAQPQSPVVAKNIVPFRAFFRQNRGALAACAAIGFFAFVFVFGTFSGAFDDVFSERIVIGPKSPSESYYAGPARLDDFVSCVGGGNSDKDVEYAFGSAGGANSAGPEVPVARRDWPMVSKDAKTEAPSAPAPASAVVVASSVPQGGREKSEEMVPLKVQFPSVDVVGTPSPIRVSSLYPTAPTSKPASAALPPSNVEALYAAKQAPDPTPINMGQSASGSVQTSTYSVGRGRLVSLDSDGIGNRQGGEIGGGRAGAIGTGVGDPVESGGSKGSGGGAGGESGVGIGQGRGLGKSVSYSSGRLVDISDESRVSVPPVASVPGGHFSNLSSYSNGQMSGSVGGGAGWSHQGSGSFDPDEESQIHGSGTIGEGTRSSSFGGSISNKSSTYLGSTSADAVVTPPVAMVASGSAQSIQFSSGSAVPTEMVWGEAMDNERTQDHQSYSGSIMPSETVAGGQFSSGSIHSRPRETPLHAENITVMGRTSGEAEWKLSGYNDFSETTTSTTPSKAGTGSLELRGEFGGSIGYKSEMKERDQAKVPSRKTRASSPAASPSSARQRGGQILYLTGEGQPPPPPPPAHSPRVFTPTASNAFSTFSLNVSDASFRLAAESLRQRRWPDAATVRAEEFVNALAYRDAPPAAGEPVALAQEQARDPFAHNRNFVRLSLQTASSGRTERQALNLTILLDTSGSMERSDRQATTAAALRALAGYLGDADSVSLIGFALRPQLIFHERGKSARDSLRKAIGTIPPEGGTNLERALLAAFEQNWKTRSAGSQNRVVLLTDGAANLGDASPDSLARLIAQNKKRGITLDCFGIGLDDYNDAMLEALARAAHGRYAFLNSVEDARGDFAKKLAGALQVAARNVKVQVEFNPARVTSWRLLGYEKHLLQKEDFRNNAVLAAQLGAAESGTAVYSVELNPDGVGAVGVVRVRYQDPRTGEYHERDWSIPFDSTTPALKNAAPGVRLAASAAMFAEKLNDPAQSAAVSLKTLAEIVHAANTEQGDSPANATLEETINAALRLE